MLWFYQHGLFAFWPWRLFSKLWVFCIGHDLWFVSESEKMHVLFVEIAELVTILQGGKRLCSGSMAQCLLKYSRLEFHQLVTQGNQFDSTLPLNVLQTAAWLNFHRCHSPTPYRVTVYIVCTSPTGCKVSSIESRTPSAPNHLLMLMLPFYAWGLFSDHTGCWRV